MTLTLRLTVLAASLAFVLHPQSAAHAQESSKANPSAETLSIESSTAPVFLGKGVLTVSTLHRHKGVYSGNYEVKVTPLTIASEKGDLSVNFSDDELHKLNQKTAVTFHGKAVSTSGKNRTVDGRATPTAADHGDITIKIYSERGKLVFHTTYRLGAN